MFSPIFNNDLQTAKLIFADMKKQIDFTRQWRPTIQYSLGNSMVLFKFNLNVFLLSFPEKPILLAQIEAIRPDNKEAYCWLIRPSYRSNVYYTCYVTNLPITLDDEEIFKAFSFGALCYYKSFNMLPIGLSVDQLHPSDIDKMKQPDWDHFIPKALHRIMF